MFLFGINYYFNNHKDELAAQIEKTLTEKSYGEIIFDSITISSLKEFPSVKIKIYNLTLIDSLYHQHKRKTVFLEEVSASLSIIDVLNEEVKIKSVSAKKGHINIFVDEDHYSNFSVFSVKQDNKEKSINLKIIDDDIDVLIEDIEFTFTEKIKNKRITAHIINIDFNVNATNFSIPAINLDIVMKEMGLNLEKGTFFNNARCVGRFHPKFGKDLSSIEIPKFNLKIAEQLFDVSVNINTKSKDFVFLLGLEDVHFNETNHLMANNIKSKLEGFDILKPFKVKAKISGRFEYKNLTLVELQYETKGNEIVYKKDSLHLKNISFKGTFINRFYEDSSIDENRKNYTFSFENLSGDYLNIPFKLTELLLKHVDSKPIHLTTSYKVEGEINHLNPIINSLNYNFSNGTFKLAGNYKGTINSFSEIINSSEITIKSNGLIIKSKHSKNRYDIPILELYINQNNAEIKKLILDLDSKENLAIHGYIKNFGSLLTNETIHKPIFSTIDISSNYLNYESLLKSFGSHSKQSQSKNILHIKQSINLLVSKFNPNLTFSLKQLDFFNVHFDDINIDAQYQENNILIKDISGNYKDGNASAKIDIILNPRKNELNEETFQLDLVLKANGEIEHWAEILNNEKFFFTDATYNLEVQLQNEVNSLKDLINNANITLNVDEGSLLFKPVNLTLPFNNISISVKNKNAFLNDFELKLPDNQSLHLKGEIDNFIEIFDKEKSTNKVSSSIIISSEDINFSNFIDTFNPSSQKSAKHNNVKIILHELYAKFKPTLNLNIEKLSYNNTELEKVNASLFFKDKNTLQLDNAYCFYFDKKLSLDVEIDISQKTQTPFKTNFTIDDFALENLLYTFNDFGYAQLKEPAELTGIINIEGNFRGLIDDSDGVIYDSLVADLAFEIKELNVNNFKPIIDAGKIVFRKERLEEIKFANIKSTLSLKDDIVSFPKTNVQSTAFDFFIEGDIAKTSYTDLWVSIPLSNFKKRDLTKAPSKKSFDEAGKKIYLEIKSKEEDELGYKVHLSEKKHRKSSN